MFGIEHASNSTGRRIAAALLLSGVALVSAGCSEIKDVVGTGLPVDSPCYVEDPSKNTVNVIPIRDEKTGTDSRASLYVVQDVTGRLCAVVSPTKSSEYYSDSKRFMGLFRKNKNNTFAKVDAGDYSSYTDSLTIDVGETAVVAAFASTCGGEASDDATGIIAQIDNSQKLDESSIIVTTAQSYDEFKEHNK